MRFVFTVLNYFFEVFFSTSLEKKFEQNIVYKMEVNMTQLALASERMMEIKKSAKNLFWKNTKLFWLFFEEEAAALYLLKNILDWKMDSSSCD